jgi:hypothetical protein
MAHVFTGPTLGRLSQDELRGYLAGRGYQQPNYLGRKKVEKQMDRVERSRSEEGDKPMPMTIRKRDVLAAVEAGTVRKQGYTRSEIWTLITKQAFKRGLCVGEYLLTDEGSKLHQVHDSLPKDEPAESVHKSAPRDAAYEAIADAAGELMAADPKLNEGEAVYKALEADPQLYVKYDKARRAKAGEVQAKPADDDDDEEGDDEDELVKRIGKLERRIAEIRAGRTAA